MSMSMSDVCFGVHVFMSMFDVHVYVYIAWHRHGHKHGHICIWIRKCTCTLTRTLKDLEFGYLISVETLMRYPTRCQTPPTSVQCQRFWYQVPLDIVYHVYQTEWPTMGERSMNYPEKRRKVLVKKIPRTGAIQLHCRKSWRNIYVPSDISKLFHEDITTNISEKCSP